jgi:hypothetical protein
MFGMRQTPHVWNTKLNATMVSLGFQHSEVEPVVYIRGKLLVRVYKDDLLIPGSGIERKR